MDSFTTYSLRCSMNSIVFPPHTQLFGFWRFLHLHCRAKISSVVWIFYLLIFNEISRFFSAIRKIKSMKTFKTCRNIFLGIFFFLGCFNGFLHFKKGFNYSFNGFPVFFHCFDCLFQCFLSRWCIPTNETMQIHR